MLSSHLQRSDSPTFERVEGSDHQEGGEEGEEGEGDSDGVAGEEEGEQGEGDHHVIV